MLIWYEIWKRYFQQSITIGKFWFDVYIYLHINNLKWFHLL